MNICSICGRYDPLDRDIRLFSNIFNSEIELPRSLDLRLLVCPYCFHGELKGLEPKLISTIYATEPSMSNIDKKSFCNEHSLTSYLLNISSSRERFIEYGSGSNQLVISLSRYFKYGVAVDPSQAGSVSELPKNIVALSSEMSEVPISENAYDLIILNQSLEHIQDVHSVFNRISKELKPDGVFYVSIPYFNYIFENSAWMDLHIRHIHYFSFTSIAHLAAQYGMYCVMSSVSLDGRDISLVFTSQESDRIHCNKKNISEHFGNLEPKLDLLLTSKAHAEVQLSEYDQPLSLYGITDLAITPINLLKCIHSVYDDNPTHQGSQIYRGPRCRGIDEGPVVDPNSLSYPILITAYNHTKQIAQRIRSSGLKSKILHGSPLTYLSEVLTN